jgi:hypothetical protein
MIPLSEQNEMGRWAVLQVLANCAPIPRLASGIRRQAERELPFTIDDNAVAAWLDFQHSAGHADFALDGAGSSKWWKITAAGALAIERR